MATDYVTRDYYRAKADDAGRPDADVDEWQAEVIERLEKWAATAWPNVTGVDGDGEAAEPRSATLVTPLKAGAIDLWVSPLIAATAVSIDGAAIDPTAYTLDLDAGSLTFLDPRGVLGLMPVTTPGIVTITTTYGFTSTPAPVKRAVVAAMKALSKNPLGEKSIPKNTRALTSEKTTFEFEQKPVEPWPWSPNASDLIATYWSTERFMAVV